MLRMVLAVPGWVDSRKNGIMCGILVGDVEASIAGNQTKYCIHDSIRFEGW
jgi:hypothetical protein